MLRFDKFLLHVMIINRLVEYLRHKLNECKMRYFLTTLRHYKTVLYRIISIVHVPSLLHNEDTHHSHDDELQWISLSVKLERKDHQRGKSAHWWTFLPSLDEEVGGEIHQLSGLLKSLVKRICNRIINACYEFMIFVIFDVLLTSLLTVNVSSWTACTKVDSHDNN